MPKVSMSLSQELHHGEDGAARGSPVGSGKEISLHIIGPGPEPGRAVASDRAHPEPGTGAFACGLRGECMFTFLQLFTQFSLTR